MLFAAALLLRIAVDPLARFNSIRNRAPVHLHT
jgi:hypothetical protein